MCAGVCKVTHALRTSPPDAVSDAISSFDDSVRRCLERVCQSSISDSAWSQAILPIRDGGLGLGAAASSAAAAFVASCTTAGPLARKLLGEEDDPIPGTQDAIDTLLSQGCTNVNELLEKEPTHGLQRRLTEPIMKKQSGNLLETSSIRDKARLISLAGECAGAWLQALPMPAMGLHIPAREFRVLLRHNLGLPTYCASRTCPACKRALPDTRGDYSLLCAAPTATG